MPCCHCDSDSLGRDYCQGCWELALAVIDAVDELPVDCDGSDVLDAFPEWKEKIARFRAAYVPFELDEEVEELNDAIQ